jgi:uncharacterized protein
MQVRDEHSGGASKRRLSFCRIAGDFAICRLAPDQPIPKWALTGAFASVTRSSEEVSIVCAAENVAEGTMAEKGWVCFKLEGPFAFSETGVLASFIDPLAKRQVPVFAVSSYDTEYVFVQQECAGTALGALKDAGHELCSNARAGSSGISKERALNSG